MRLVERSIIKNPGQIEAGIRWVDVYEVLVHEIDRDIFRGNSQLNGFSQISDGFDIIDKQTGMIRLRLASLIEGE